MPPIQEPERPSVGDRCARSAAEDQTDVIDFLLSPAAYTASRGGVARYETHGALVFAAGDDVYKIKRAVRFAYMDFSTIDRRERILRRELEVNRVLAPELYLEIIPVTREPDGRLALNGSGEPVEWALHMRRFRDEDLLSSIASPGDRSSAHSR
ncbi:MAG: hypothetical protein HC774_04160, partial [Sphingomonadales bacterium]|nr:hypothetical protein [Sphingomonadales bacterium]